MGLFGILSNIQSEADQIARRFGNTILIQTKISLEGRDPQQTSASPYFSDFWESFGTTNFILRIVFVNAYKEPML